MTVALIDVSPSLRAALEQSSLTVVAYDSLREFDSAKTGNSEVLDAIVLGETVLDPIRGASHAYRVEPAMSVVILAGDQQQCQRIHEALRFAPLVGTDVSCAVMTPGAVELIANAAARTRVRRRRRQVLTAIEPRVEPLATRALAREYYADQLMGLAPVAMVAVDEDYRVATANPVAERIFGRSERQLLGLHLGGTELGEDGGSWARLLQSAGAGPSETVTFERGTAGGQVIEARAVTMIIGSIRGYLVVFDDVTARARLEEQRRIAYDQAEHASQLKDEFIATISHELRTPLNAIIGWAQLLTAGGISGEHFDHALRVIDRNARAQAALVGDLLDVSTIVSGKMRLSIAAANVREALERALEAVLPAARAKNVHIARAIAEDLPSLPADVERLQQVIWNLLSNAVKFTPPGGQVHLGLQRVTGAVELEVRDSGEGIAPDVLPFLFDPFRQADGGRARRHGGLGLGLTIVRRIVEMHGGTVTAASAGLGKGAEFRVRLPISALSASAPIHASVTDEAREPARFGDRPGAALARSSVLVVDDDDDARELLQMTLELAGARVQAADSVAVACQMLASAQPDLVISDIGMPIEDGYVLASYVRHHFGSRLPLIALTAFATREDRERTTASGFDAHLAKPVEANLLLATASSLVELSR